MFAPLDYTVLAAYFALCAFVGWRAGRGQKDTADYFKGGGRMPMWAVCLSILATETSALTFCQVPGLAYKGNLTYLQFAFGLLLGRILVGVLLVALYYDAGVTTVYEYLGSRFGPVTRTAASVLFLVTRLLADAVRLTAASLVVHAVTGWPFALCVAAFTAVTVLYSVFGGIKSIIWTDVLQFFLFIGGAAAALLLIVGDIGVAGLLDTLRSSPGKLRVIDTSLDLHTTHTVFTAFLGGTLLSFATHGTDQDIVQRMLTCSESRHGSRSVILSGVLNIPMVALFLLIGACLFAYDHHHPERLAGLAAIAPDAGDPNRVFPYFIVYSLPAGLRGLVIAAVFAAAMSTTSSAIGALTSVAVTDVLNRIAPRPPDAGRDLRRSRLVAVAVSVALVLLGIRFAGVSRSLLDMGLEVMTYCYGALLGVFVLGRLTKTRGDDRGNVIAMALSIYAVLALKFNTLFFPLLLTLPVEHLAPLFPRPVAWTWYIVAGFAVMVAIGALFRTRRVAVGASGPAADRKEL